MLDGAADVLCRSNELSQAVIVTPLRADCCGHVPVMVTVARVPTSREKLRAWQPCRRELARKSVECRDREHRLEAWAAVDPSYATPGLGVESNIVAAEVSHDIPRF